MRDDTPGVPAGRHEDEIASGQGDIGRDARAFEAARLLDDLHEDLVADLEHLADGVSAAALGHLFIPDVDRVATDVVYIEKGIAAEADVDEARPHAREDVLDATFVDRADDLFFAFEVDLSKRAFFQDGDAVFPIVG